MSENADLSTTAQEVKPAGDQPKIKYQFKERPDAAGVPFMAPDVPRYFVTRGELIDVKSVLLERGTASLAPLTLYGSNGSGKSSLASAIAHDADILELYNDGVLWITLGEGNDMQKAQAVWSEALGLDISHLPDSGGRSSALRALLHDSKILLVIDDVTDMEQVKALNIGGPNCARLITTADEEVAFAFKSRRFELSKMSEVEALSLLTEWSGLLPDIYLPTVKEIIKRLGSNPLALALVGGQARQGIAWLRLLEVLRNDQGPIATLEVENPDVLKNALGLVVNLALSRFGGAHLQRAALLGAFAAGSSAPFSALAAGACWELSVEETTRTLNLLIDSALVLHVSDNLYSIHPALRDHLRKAANPNDSEAASQRIREHYLSMLEGSTVTLDQIDAELGQIMKALAYAQQHDSGMAQVFADSLLTYFERAGLWANLVALATATIDTAHEDGDVMREHMYLNDLGYAHTVLGNFEEALSRFERSLEISRALGDPTGESAALNNIGAIHERQANYEKALGYYQKSLAIRERLGVKEDIADTLNNIAGVLYWQEQWEEALSTFQRVLDMFDVLANRTGQAQTLLNIGAANESMGKEFEALTAYERSLAIYSNLNDENGQAQAMNNLGIIYFNQGDTERALSNFKRSLAIKDKLGDRSGQAATLNNMAFLYESTGSLPLALEQYQKSYEILDDLTDPRAEVVQENIELLQKRMKSA